MKKAWRFTKFPTEFYLFIYNNKLTKMELYYLYQEDEKFNSETRTISQFSSVYNIVTFIKDNECNIIYNFYIFTIKEVFNEEFIRFLKIIDKSEKVTKICANQNNYNLFKYAVKIGCKFDKSLYIYAIVFDCADFRCL